MQVLQSALIILGATITSAFAQDDHTWTTYTNDRFGVSICYPADLVHAEPPPVDGDGLGFVAKDGAKIDTWGSNNAESAQEDAKRLAGSTGHVTYEIVRKDFYVVSGRNGGTIFYNRTALSHGIYSTVEITYPAADGKIWNAITAHISKCFHPGSGSDLN
ncbi:MAG: hypothetical protein AB1508_03750 [Pseudomonadota bacterium]